MKKTIIFRIIGLIGIIALIGIVLTVPTLVIRNNFENTLDNIAQENDVISDCVIYGKLHTEDETYDLYKLCKKENKNYSLKEVFCTHNSRAYFVCQEVEEEDIINWVIASIGLEHLDFQVHCELKIASELYNTTHTNDYSERNGYYHDGNIVLNDHESILMYNVSSDTTDIYPYSKHSFPKCEIYGECIDSETIKLNIQSDNRTFTFLEMSKNSDSIASIYALKNKKIWSGDSAIKNFFSDGTVQVIDGKIYTIGECLNYSGEAHAVIFEYDYEEDLWKYVRSIYSGDIVSGNCYLISNNNIG